MLAAQEILGCKTHLFVLACNTYKALGITSIPGSIQLSDTGMTHNHLLFTRSSWEGFRKKVTGNGLKKKKSLQNLPCHGT